MVEVKSRDVENSWEIKKKNHQIFGHVGDLGFRLKVGGGGEGKKFGVEVVFVDVNNTVQSNYPHNR